LTNKEIAQILNLHAQLLEFYGANSFQVRGYQSGAEIIRSMESDIQSLTEKEIQDIEGIGKGLANTISEILQTGTIKDLSENLDKTPAELVELIQTKGLGSKKLKTIFDELQISSADEILEAAKQNKLSSLKGFGTKTQDKFINVLEFRKKNLGKRRYADVEQVALELLEKIRKVLDSEKVEFVGSMRRKDIVVDTIEILAATENISESLNAVKSSDFFEPELKNSGPFVLRGKDTVLNMPVTIHFASIENFINQLFWLTGSARHLGFFYSVDKSFANHLQEKKYQSEEEIYADFELKYIIPELREGTFEISAAQKDNLPETLDLSDLKGILHNHSTYSDGKNTLKEMAEYCKELGFEYLGISDHSQSAFYANGLTVDRIKKQHDEIDKLNEELAPFSVFFPSL
jgi:DNA polymerase (family 10)